MKLEPDYYVSFRSGRRKCYTINMPFIHQRLLDSVNIFVRNGFFPQGRRPDDTADSNRFYWYTHYPGQRFTSYPTIKYAWPTRTNKSKNYAMRFTIKNVDVVTRRNKSPEECVDDWLNFDQQLMDKMMIDAGCRPPHWSSTSKLPICFKNSVL